MGTILSPSGFGSSSITSRPISSGAFHETFPAPEAHRVLRRLEFDYVPNHASWADMAEIEIGVLREECLDCRLGERELLIFEIAT